LQAGADGDVLKDDGRSELMTAVKHVAAGRRYISPAICDRLMSGYVRAGEQPERTSRTGSWEILTERKRKVLKPVAER